MEAAAAEPLLSFLAAVGLREEVGGGMAVMVKGEGVRGVDEVGDGL